jgi:hypothetical protein
MTTQGGEGVSALRHRASGRPLDHGRAENIHHFGSRSTGRISAKPMDNI